ncbi:bis(5'-nucleosyl)-tetraphosphatase PrpE [Virgibacillus litoralis]|uniref:Diadenosine tetraphosphatase ApaH/serine/threonine PP2A family protein phosphatase n=1 Tax=Virgibacillus litoralis TaxID=578221 RepID=A0ABS4H8I9_9BACI|nr:bis(5'-nucleosyl)-tetraphosphatase PrpE [Virgibacillus litoralis]MBP1947221.1 diadenosine tetraphosphatase ApaH/serine/threonine PP2A family protein phosphatase [Virgibacillus litoralis]
MKIDVIGDVHGCMEELQELFHTLGYRYERRIFLHPDGRTPVFLGDITDRGPHSIALIKLVYDMVIVHKKARYVPGNHCNKLYRYFLGNDVKQRYGLETTVAEYTSLPKSEQQTVKEQFIELYENTPLYLEIPEVKTIVAHAGIKEEYIGRTDKRVKTFVLYGDITGKFDEDGRPIRRDWAQDYQGSYWIVYGHTPIKQPRTINKTINIDTGCVFGNMLTAFRLPEEKVVSVQSKQPLVEEKFHYFE